MSDYRTARFVRIGATLTDGFAKPTGPIGGIHPCLTACATEGRRRAGRFRHSIWERSALTVPPVVPGTCLVRVQRWRWLSWGCLRTAALRAVVAATRSWSKSRKTSQLNLLGSTSPKFLTMVEESHYSDGNRRPRSASTREEAHDA
jgi:hypothetical protein